MTLQWQCLLLAVAGIAIRRMSEKIRQLRDALNNMSQGLCTFDGSARIVVFNQQYLRMYNLSPEIVKPGLPLRRLMEHRKAVGLFTGDPEKYCKEIQAGIAAGKTSKWLIGASDGRIVHAVNQPTPDGGWVSTHEDVTEQQKLQRQRDEMAGLNQRREAVDAAIVAFRRRDVDVAADLRRQRGVDEIDRDHAVERLQPDVAAGRDCGGCIERGLDRREDRRTRDR